LSVDFTIIIHRKLAKKLNTATKIEKFYTCDGLLYISKIECVNASMNLEIAGMSFNHPGTKTQQT